MKGMNLVPALERLAAGDRAAIRAESGRCLHHWNQENTCQLCTDACPTQAITLAADGVFLDDAACVRCGYCLHACPTGVFTGVDETARLLQSAAVLPHFSVLDLTCGHFPTTYAQPNVETILQVGGCLAALGAAAYVGLAALGVDCVGVRLEACAGCPIGALRTQIEDTIARAGGLTSMAIMAVDAAPADCVPKPVQETRARQYTRRTLLRRFMGGEPAPASPLPGLDSAAPEGKSPPLERRSLLQVLAHLPDDRRAPGAFFPSLTADPSCTACQVCGTVCPTGALSFAARDGVFALHFSPLTCTDCALCVELCAPAALQGSDAVDYGNAHPVVLLEGHLKQCRRCRASFAGAGDLCPACAFRRRHPSGSLPRPAASARHAPESD